ncbi:hypothetical protein LX32DRAFT_696196 [Colletotrichum zoysiae]|uniref:2EXR domain-containing protein n=1 Tax=Colletotrichum zoysiae TaxID=1216348 RepID=A0AAD9HCT3_9PEZI|nr:hypothetical protein LX32DRAFT_696196 [Colletotrichum zoysiae]
MSSDEVPGGRDRQIVQKHMNAMEKLWNALRGVFVSVGPVRIDLDIPATSFPRFRQLPAEIRCLIWKHSLPSGRIYEPRPYRDWIMYDPRPVQFYQHWPPPVMREACKEAYQVCMENGSFRFGYYSNSRPGMMRSIWYNDKKDMVYLHTFDQWDSLDLFEVKNICISTEIALNREHCERVLAHLGCGRVVVAYYPPGTPTPEQLSTTRPVFRPISNEDEFVTVQKVDPEDWDEGLELTWGENKDFVKDCWEKENLGKSVEIEAVEVFRKAREDVWGGVNTWGRLYTGLY